MSEYTPLPWKVEERRNVSAIVHDGGNDICVLHFHYEHCGEPCGALESQDKTTEEIKANAVFIAGACNAHDDLVDALEDMIRRFAPTDDGLGEAEIASAARARDAIANAEWRKP